MKKSQEKEWEGKKILIIGATGGVGEAAAKIFFEAGADIFITGRSMERLNNKKACMFKNSERVVCFSENLETADGCRRTVEACKRKMKSIDVLVNCAGVYIEGAAENTTEEVWDTIIDTNLKGSFFMCRYAIPLLKKTKGCIININSDAGMIGNKGASVYCASKGGVTLFTKALALELAEYGVRVNAVCPGVIHTKMIEECFSRSGFRDRKEYDRKNLAPYPQGKLARYIDAREVAELIFFLASEKKAAAITGACVSIDMGVTAGY